MIDPFFTVTLSYPVFVIPDPVDTFAKVKVYPIKSRVRLFAPIVMHVASQVKLVVTLYIPPATDKVAGASTSIADAAVLKQRRSITIPIILDIK